MHFFFSIFVIFFKVESKQEFGHKVTELTILAQSVNGYFRCLAMNKAGSDSDVKRVVILPPDGIFILLT